MKETKLRSLSDFNKFISRDELNKEMDKILGLKNGRIVKRKRNKLFEWIRSVFKTLFIINSRDKELIEDYEKGINKIEEIRKKQKIIF